MNLNQIKQILLTLSIVVVLSVFVFYAISVFYEEPTWDKYCGKVMPRVPAPYETQETCESQGGVWQGYPEPASCPPNEKCPKGYCDIHATCSKEFEAHRQVYERNVFIMGVCIGLALLILGIFLRGASVSTGIMGGGVIILVVSLLRYWGNLSKYLRLAILAVVLALLIFVAYKKFDSIKQVGADKEQSTENKNSVKKSKRKK